MKKAQGMPLSVIILAIIMLVVLVVLIVIFTRSTGKFGTAAESCQTRGGECLTGIDKCSQASGAVYAPVGGKCDSGICCAKLYETAPEGQQ